MNVEDDIVLLIDDGWSELIAAASCFPAKLKVFE